MCERMEWVRREEITISEAFNLVRDGRGIIVRDFSKKSSPLVFWELVTVSEFERAMMGDVKNDPV